MTTHQSRISTREDKPCNCDVCGHVTSWYCDEDCYCCAKTGKCPCQSDDTLETFHKTINAEIQEQLDKDEFEDLTGQEAIPYKKDEKL